MRILHSEGESNGYNGSSGHAYQSTLIGFIGTVVVVVVAVLRLFLIGTVVVLVVFLSKSKRAKPGFTTLLVSAAHLTVPAPADLSQIPVV